MDSNQTETLPAGNDKSPPATMTPTAVEGQITHDQTSRSPPTHPTLKTHNQDEDDKITRASVSSEERESGQGTSRMSCNNYLNNHHHQQNNKAKESMSGQNYESQLHMANASVEAQLDFYMKRLVKVQTVVFDLLSEYAIFNLIGQPLDLQKWSRKVFKIYKTLKMIEQKLNASIFQTKNLASEESLDISVRQPCFLQLSSQMLKLVAVLFNFQKGMTQQQVAQQMCDSIEQMQEKTDDICKEGANASQIGTFRSNVSQMSDFQSASKNNLNQMAANAKNLSISKARKQASPPPQEIASARPPSGIKRVQSNKVTTRSYDESSGSKKIERSLRKDPSIAHMSSQKAIPTRQNSACSDTQQPELQDSNNTTQRPIEKSCISQKIASKPGQASMTSLPKEPLSALVNPSDQDNVLRKTKSNKKALRNQLKKTIGSPRPTSPQHGQSLVSQQQQDVGMKSMTNQVTSYKANQLIENKPPRWESVNPKKKHSQQHVQLQVNNSSYKQIKEWQYSNGFGYEKQEKRETQGSRGRQRPKTGHHANAQIQTSAKQSIGHQSASKFDYMGHLAGIPQNLILPAQEKAGIHTSNKNHFPSTQPAKTQRQQSASGTGSKAITLILKDKHQKLWHPPQSNNPSISNNCNDLPIDFKQHFKTLEKLQEARSSRMKQRVKTNESQLTGDSRNANNSRHQSAPRFVQATQPIPQAVHQGSQMMSMVEMKKPTVQMQPQIISNGSKDQNKEPRIDMQKSEKHQKHSHAYEPASPLINTDTTNLTIKHFENRSQSTINQTNSNRD